MLPDLACVHDIQYDIIWMYYPDVYYRYVHHKLVLDALHDVCAGCPEVSHAVVEAAHRQAGPAL